MSHTEQSPESQYDDRHGAQHLDAVTVQLGERTDKTIKELESYLGDTFSPEIITTDVHVVIGTKKTS